MQFKATLTLFLVGIQTLLFSQKNILIPDMVQPGSTHSMYLRPDGIVGCTDNQGMLTDALKEYSPDIQFNNSFTSVPAPTATLQADIAAATPIVVTYTGFTPEAQAAFQFAVNVWAGLIKSTQTIRISAVFTPLAAGVLGSAGPNQVWGINSAGATSWYPDALSDNIMGFDIDPTAPDINAKFNSSFNFYYGTDGRCPAGKYDFVSVVLHELGHGLGFLGSVRSNTKDSPCTGIAGVGCWGYKTGTTLYPSIYDRFTKLGSNPTTATTLLNTSSFPNPSSNIYAALTSTNLYFHGTNAMSINKGLAPKLNAPTTYSLGSSFSHFEEGYYRAGNANSLMTSNLNSAESVHNIGPVGCAVMRDIGWPLSGACLIPVPVELVSVNAKHLHDYNEIEWETASEHNNNHFVVERSQDGNSFKGIGTVQGAGTTNEAHSYSFQDVSPLDGVNYYRLRQVDNDGKEDFSKIVSVVSLSEGKSVKRVFPNPTYDLLTVEHTPSVQKMEVTNTFGQIVQSVTPNSSGTTTINTADLINGIYFIKINQSETIRFIKL